jgi:hypothetical protein
MPRGYLDVYGGEYSVACKDPSAVRAKISEDGLSLSRGSTTINAGFELDALSHFGNNPPPDFASALVPALVGKGMIFVIYKTKSGLVLDVDGDSAVLKQIGAVKAATKLKKCESGRVERAKHGVPRLPAALSDG